MAFDLSAPATQFHYQVNLVVNGEAAPIMAVFKASHDISEVDGVVRQIVAIDEKMKLGTSEGLHAELRSIARGVFQGWANPDGREDLWVTHGGQPVDPSPEQVEAFLSVPGVAYGLCLAFVEAHQSREASLGNSVPSRGNGFKAEAARARDKTATRS